MTAKKQLKTFDYWTSFVKVKVVKILANLYREMDVKDRFWQKSAGEWERNPGSIQAFLQLAILAFPWPCPLPLIVTHSDRNLDQNSDQNSDLTFIEPD